MERPSDLEFLPAGDAPKRNLRTRMAVGESELEGGWRSLDGLAGPAALVGGGAAEEERACRRAEWADIRSCCRRREIGGFGELSRHSVSQRRNAMKSGHRSVRSRGWSPFFLVKIPARSGKDRNVEKLCTFHFAQLVLQSKKDSL